MAIAAHETMLETYGPSQVINNAFGLGPGWAFASERDAIARAARALAELYLPEGRTTLATIGPKWAPIGAANDPTGLNRNWTAGSATYSPRSAATPNLPILASAQAAPPAATARPAALAAPAAARGPGSRRARRSWSAWGGVAAGPRPARRPRASSSRSRCRWAAPAAYGRRPGAARPARGGVTIAAAPGAHAVASVAGTLRGAAPAEARGGHRVLGRVRGRRPRSATARWPPTRPGSSRRRRSPPGQPLGTSAGALRVAWERGGARLDPVPLLEATRPPS